MRINYEGLDSYSVTDESDPSQVYVICEDEKLLPYLFRFLTDLALNDLPVGAIINLTQEQRDAAKITGFHSLLSPVKKGKELQNA